MDEKKIGTGVAAALMLFAISIDAFEAIFDMLTGIPYIGVIIGPPLATFISIVGAVILCCWFYYLDVKFIGRMGPAILMEIVPLLNILPAYTLATFLTILAANNEKFSVVLGGLGLAAGGSAAGLGLRSEIKGAVDSNTRARNEIKRGFRTEDEHKEDSVRRDEVRMRSGFAPLRGGNSRQSGGEPRSTIENQGENETPSSSPRFVDIKRPGGSRERP